MLSNTERVTYLCLYNHIVVTRPRSDGGKTCQRCQTANFLRGFLQLAFSWRELLGPALLSDVQKPHLCDCFVSPLISPSQLLC